MSTETCNISRQWVLWVFRGQCISGWGFCSPPVPLPEWLWVHLNIGIYISVEETDVSCLCRSRCLVIWGPDYSLFENLPVPYLFSNISGLYLLGVSIIPTPHHYYDNHRCLQTLPVVLHLRTFGVDKALESRCVLWQKLCGEKRSRLKIGTVSVFPKWILYSDVNIY